MVIITDLNKDTDTSIPGMSVDDNADVSNSGVSGYNTEDDDTKAQECLQKMSMAITCRFQKWIHQKYLI